MPARWTNPQTKKGKFAKGAAKILGPVGLLELGLHATSDSEGKTGFAKDMLELPFEPHDAMRRADIGADTPMWQMPWKYAQGVGRGYGQKAERFDRERGDYLGGDEGDQQEAMRQGGMLDDKGMFRTTGEMYGPGGRPED